MAIEWKSKEDGELALELDDEEGNITAADTAKSTEKQKSAFAATDFINKARGYVFFSRPLLRSVLTITSYLSLLFSIGAFYMTYRVSYSYFFDVSIHAFSFNVQNLIFWCLMSNGLFSIGIYFSGKSIVRNPDNCNRYFGAFASLASAVALLTTGITIVGSGLNLDEHIDMFCDGGFPPFTLITKIYINAFREIETNYIGRYMCKKYDF